MLPDWRRYVFEFSILLYSLIMQFSTSAHHAIPQITFGGTFGVFISVLQWSLRLETAGCWEHVILRITDIFQQLPQPTSAAVTPAAADNKRRTRHLLWVAVDGKR